jgi:hypothetical protein
MSKSKHDRPLNTLKDAFEKAGQTQDLTHHKTQETDTLVKAERPADDFMKYNQLDKETHGRSKDSK